MTHCLLSVINTKDLSSLEASCGEEIHLNSSEETGLLKCVHVCIQTSGLFPKALLGAEVQCQKVHVFHIMHQKNLFVVSSTLFS